MKVRFDTQGTLPVAKWLLPGPPSAFPEFLSGDRHPVAPSAERASRYWYELPHHSPLIDDRQLCMRARDYLMIETDRNILDRKTDLVDQLIAVKLSSTGLGCARVKGIEGDRLSIWVYGVPTDRTIADLETAQPAIAVTGSIRSVIRPKKKRAAVATESRAVAELGEQPSLASDESSEKLTPPQSPSDGTETGGVSRLISISSEGVAGLALCLSRSSLFQ